MSPDFCETEHDICQKEHYLRFRLLSLQERSQEMKSHATQSRTPVKFLQVLNTGINTNQTVPGSSAASGLGLPRQTHPSSCDPSCKTLTGQRGSAWNESLTPAPSALPVHSLYLWASSLAIQVPLFLWLFTIHSSKPKAQKCKLAEYWVSPSTGDFIQEGKSFDKGK